MDIQQVLSSFDRELRREITHPGMRREVLPGLVRYLREPPGMSFIAWADLPEDRADEIIAAQAADLSARGLRFTWDLYSHDHPADLMERLKAHGFTREEEPGAVMVLDLENPPAELLRPVQVDIRPLTRPEQLEDAIQVLEPVWGSNFGWMRDRMGPQLANPEYLSMVAAYVEGHPTCVGWTIYQPGGQFASLYGGSTLPELRGRGLYTAVLAVRVQEALRRGRRYMLIDASDMSRPIAARHGFIQISTSHVLEWQASQ